MITAGLLGIAAGLVLFLIVAAVVVLGLIGWGIYSLFN